MLALAALVELVLGVFLFLLGRWGRLSADQLVPSFMHREERLRRADSLARAALFCQGVGLVLLVFGLGTAIATLFGAEPTLRPQ